MSNRREDQAVILYPLLQQVHSEAKALRKAVCQKE
jgi:hypothetical protein